MKITSISQLRPYDRNAKQHPPKQIKLLAEIIERFGFNVPIIVDQEGTIVAGHGRLEAAKKLGYQTVKVGVARAKKGEKFIPAIYADDLTPDEVKAYRLADNKIAESGWDKNLIIEELNALQLAGFDLKLTGFDADILLSETKDDEHVPVVSGSKPRSKPGDLYIMGEHRLVVGDSTDEGLIGVLFDGARARMTFTDPPYNIDYTGGVKPIVKNGVRIGYDHKPRNGEKIKHDKMSNEDFFAFLEQAMRRVIENTDGAIYVAMSSSELGNLKRAFEIAGGHWSSYVIWVKNTFPLSRTDYQQQFEPILYGWPERVRKHFFIGDRDIANVWEDITSLKTKFDGQFTTIKFQGFEVRIKGKAEGAVRKKKQYTDIWRFDKPLRSEDHPTMKPVALVLEAIKNSSKMGEIVFDPFLGSGTTLIAAEKAGRICYGAELDLHYADVIVKRWEEYTGKKAELIR